MHAPDINYAMSGGKRGTRLDSFKNQKQIGHGGFGIVYSAERENGERVAIKKIDKAASQARIQEEIKTMKQLDHRNIVRLYEDFYDSGDTYLVMELCEGGSLMEFVRENGPLDDSTAVHILRQLVMAVKYMHSKHFVHRDLSAGNVFLKDTTKAKITVKLGDFGLATNLGKGGTACTIVGTPGYIAPQVFNQDYDQSADVYSLGAVLFTMLTKHSPPPTKGTPNTNEIAKRNRSAAELVEKMMHPDPRKRIRLQEIFMHNYVKENTDEEGRLSRDHSRDSRHQNSREPLRSSRDGRSQDRRPQRSSSQPVNSGRMTHNNRVFQDRIPVTSYRGVNSSENERGRHNQRYSGRGLGPSNAPQPDSHAWPIRMERLAGQRIRTAGGRYIVEMDTRCRFEVAAQGDIVRRILIVEWDQHQQTQTVSVHKIIDRIEHGRDERDTLIELTKTPTIYTALSELPKEVYNDYMRLQKMVVSNLASRVAKITCRRPSQFPDAHAQLMENGDLRIKFPKSVIVRKRDTGEIYNCVDGFASRKEDVHEPISTRVKSVYAYLIRFEKCLSNMDHGMIFFPIVFSAGSDIIGNSNNSPSSMMPPASQASRFPFSNISSNQQSLVPHSAPFLMKPQSSRTSSTLNAPRRVSTDENTAPAMVPLKYKIKLDSGTDRVRSLQATDGRVLRCSTSIKDQFIFTDPSIRPDDQRFMRTGKVPERASEMLNMLLDRIRKQKNA